ICGSQPERVHMQFFSRSGLQFTEQNVNNYIIHKSSETLRWLKANPKFRVIYQPVYSPWVNHVERLWQALHETITRNHQCRSMWQLLKKVRHFMDTVSPFPGGKHGLAKV
uniref:transposase n=1 Tax=Escherichia coli TaxID=562 RepID=UPI001FCF1EAF